MATGLVTKYCQVMANGRSELSKTIGSAGITVTNARINACYDPNIWAEIVIDKGGASEEILLASHGEQQVA